MKLAHLQLKGSRTVACGKATRDVGRFMRQEDFEKCPADERCPGCQRKLDEITQVKS